jgi:hypothetical protein
MEADMAASRSGVFTDASISRHANDLASASSSSSSNNYHRQIGVSSLPDLNASASLINVPNNPNPIVGPTPFPPFTTPAPPVLDPLIASQDFNGGWRLAVDNPPFTSGLEGISGLPLDIYHATSAVGVPPPPPSLDMNRDNNAWAMNAEAQMTAVSSYTCMRADTRRGGRCG